MITNVLGTLQSIRVICKRSKKLVGGEGFEPSASWSRTRPTPTSKATILVASTVAVAHKRLGTPFQHCSVGSQGAAPQGLFLHQNEENWNLFRNHHAPSESRAGTASSSGNLCKHVSNMIWRHEESALTWPTSRS